MKRIKTLLFLIAAFVAIPAGTVLAESVDGPSIDIPIDTIVYDVEGSRTLLAEVPVDEALQGMECTAVAVSINPGSKHPGNDIVIESNGSFITIVGVEDEKGPYEIEAEGILKLGSSVKVYLDMGPDAVFSGGMTLKLTCELPEPVQPDVTFDFRGPSCEDLHTYVKVSTGEGDEAVDVTVLANGTPVIDQSMNPNEMIEMSFKDLEDTKYVGLVNGENAVTIGLATPPTEEECADPRPGAEFVVRCDTSTGVADVDVKNTGDVEGDFTLDGQTLVLAPGAEGTFTDVPNGSHELVFGTEGEEQVLIVLVDCQKDQTDLPDAPTNSIPKLVARKES